MEVRIHEKIDNAYMEKFLQLGAMVFSEDTLHMATMPSFTLNMQ